MQPTAHIALLRTIQVVKVLDRNNRCVIMKVGFAVLILFMKVFIIEAQTLLSCNFDEDFCQFSSDPDANLMWERRRGPTITGDTGPESDHTTGDPDKGFYAYIEASGAGTGELARLLSPTITETAHECSTISFYYHMYGEDIGSLNLYLVHDPPPYMYDNPVWGLSGDQGKDWNKAEINVTFPTNLKMVFEGTAIRGIFENQGDIAIDDVSVEIGKCEPKTCDPAVPWCKNGGSCIDVSNNATTEDYYVCDCPPGWEGVHCELDADECASNPCENGGTCTHGINSFQCFCDIGFHGSNCEFVNMCIDPDLGRCQNGGTCHPIENDLVCACAPGYSGKFCESELDECDVMPCIHGNCTDLVNDYECICDVDWVGRNCSMHRGSCVFDYGEDACGYTTTPMVDYLWKANSGSTPNLGTGPDSDHTTGEGTYMFADASNEGEGGTRALLYSPFVTQEAVGTCSNIRFWYFMSGNTVGTLNLYASGTGNNELESNPIWTVSDDQGDQWMLGETNLSSSVPYSLTFEAVSTFFVAYRGDIAIDDVVITPNACVYEYCSEKPCQNGGTCVESSGQFTCICSELWTGQTCTEDSNLCLSNPCQNGGTCIDGHQSYVCQCDTSMFVGTQCEYELGSCDFEDMDLQLCNYENIYINFHWDLMTGSTPSDLTGPNSDHTTGSGYYIYAEATGRVGGEKARIRSPVVPGSAGGCTHLSFWYLMRGNTVGELAVHVELVGTPLLNPIWTKVGDDRNGWTNVKINVSAPYDFQVVFEAIMRDESLIDDDNRGDIAIDDIIVTSDTGCSYESCFVQPCLNGGTCIAEGDAYKCLCPSDFGGPNCETFAPCDPNPCKNGGSCFPDENNEGVCICRPGFIGDTCENIDHCFPDPCINGGVCTSGEVSFECECVPGYEGTTCESEINECLSYPCLNGGTCVDLLDAYSCQCTDQFFGDTCEKVTGSCDFEGDSFCGWKPDPNSEYNWMINSGPAPSAPLTGPSQDHTLQTPFAGYYIFTPVSYNSPPEGSVYRIRSPTIRFNDYPSNQFTVELFYHMKGDGIGTLNVYLEEAGRPEYPIYQVIGEQGGEWLPFQSPVTVGNDWAIIVEHSTIETLLYLGELAIDDVKITMNPTSVKPTEVFNCDFDEDFCVFSSDPTGELTWDRRRGPTFTDDTGPESDHTTGDPNGGFYTYIEASGARTGDLARTLSPTIIGTAHECSTISFYYHMYGEDIGSLNLYLVHDPPPYMYDNPVWGLSGDQGNDWNKAEINVTFPVNLKLVFEGIALSGLFENQGDMAIDDITVEVRRCQPKTCDPSVTWCKNGGSCIDVSNNATTEDYYVCDCPPGWEGVHCELDADECASNPCENGGTCTHGINSFQCLCAIGYHGPKCQYVNLCISPELHRCENGGTCVPDEDTFSCSCAPGYLGQYCEIERDECDSSPCLYGDCTDLVADYVCACYEDWMGRNCNIKKGGCIFDDGLDTCGYTTTPVVDYLWQANSGSTPNFGTGPDSDHTTGEGTYMYADASNEGEGGTRALLYSPFVTQEAVGTCSVIRFWYHMSGNSVGTLNLYASGTGNNELETNPIWSVSGDQGDQWIQGEASLSSSVPYSLTFEAVSAFYLIYAGDIAIDDVVINPSACDFSSCSGKPCQNGGTCFEDESGEVVCSCAELWAGPTCTEDSNLCLSNPCQNGGTCIDGHQSYVCECDTSMFVGNQCEYELGSCDFEDMDLQLCNYENDINGDFNWDLMIGSTPSDLTGPNSDHTTGSGYYIYTEATGRVGGEKARIRSPVVPGSGGGCTHFSFWYHMRGSAVGELAVQVEEDNGPLPGPIWTKIGGDGVGWTNVLINMSVPTDFKLVFEATMRDPSIIEDDNRGDIAVDDIEIRTGVGCSYEACFVQPCLNGGTCIGEEDSYKCFCPVGYGGPNCETFSSCSPNPCENGGECTPNENNEIICLCPVGYTGPTCEEVDYCYPYPCYNNATCVSQVVSFECECVSGYEGTTCESEINECLSNPCLNGGTCEDLLDAYSCQCTEQFFGNSCEKVKGSCDFEEGGMCGWYSDPKTDYNWKLESGQGPNWPFSGPLHDHTYDSVLEDGHYLYTPVYQNNEDNMAGFLYRVRSQQMVMTDYDNNVFIIDLFYHMKGRDTGILSVYIEESGKPEYSIFRIEGQQEDEWMPFNEVVMVENDWAIILEYETVELTVFEMGDVAIDDVTITAVPAIVTDTTTSAIIGTTTTNGLPVTTGSDDITTMTYSTTSEDFGEPDGNNGGLDAGAVAGIVIGILLAIVLIVGSATYYMVVYRPGKKQKEQRMELNSNTPGVENPNFSL